MALYLIRHLEPRGARRVCYGRRDLHCDAQELASEAIVLRARLPESVLRDCTVYTSPLSRCRALAEMLSAPHMPRISEELIELDFGVWEGVLWDDLPRTELDAWAADVWNYRPGGGESAGMVEERWRQWCERFASPAHGAIVAVTHAGVIRAALAASGVLAREEAACSTIAFGSVHRIGPPSRRLPARGARSCATI